MDAQAGLASQHRSHALGGVGLATLVNRKSTVKPSLPALSVAVRLRSFSPDISYSVSLLATNLRTSGLAFHLQKERSSWYSFVCRNCLQESQCMILGRWYCNEGGDQHVYSFRQTRLCFTEPCWIMRRSARSGANKGPTTDATNDGAADNVSMDWPDLPIFVCARVGTALVAGLSMLQVQATWLGLRAPRRPLAGQALRAGFGIN